MGGERAILKHPFFYEKIDWELLEMRQVKPPFKPKIVSSFHLSDFYSMFYYANVLLFLLYESDRKVYFF